MALSINLRSDLAKLTDAELAQRLEDNWRAHEATGLPRPGRFSIQFPLMYSFRAPFRHRRVYRFLAVLGGGSGTWLDILFATLLSSGRLEKLIRASDPVTNAHLSLCEIRDIMDEIERRVAQRKHPKQ